METTTAREGEVLAKICRMNGGKRNIQRRCQVVRERTIAGKRRVDLHQQGYSYPFIDRWSDRWIQSLSDRRKWEIENAAKLNNDRLYVKFLTLVLSDAYRCGTPPKFDVATREKIVALAVTRPRDLGLPFDCWSNDLLQRQVIKRGIASSISVSRVGVFLKAASSATSFE